MLAGNIVQVRLERKALSAAVGPTCCSGREQRSKTASAGSAIPSFMKAALRKQLRAERLALSEPDHRHRSVAAARAIIGISVPRRRLTPISQQWLDLIVIPLVGVDSAGRRQGMGGGYYVRQNREWSISYELLAVQIGACHLQHR